MKALEYVTLEHRYTSKTHPDRENIAQAINLCSQVASYCNEKLERKRLEMLAETVRDRFRGQGLVRNDTRHVLKEQSLIKVNRHGNNQERVFVLFNDALAYGVGTPEEGVDLHKVYYMGEFGVFKVKDSKECFEVRCRTEKGTARIFTVRTQSEKCRDEWLKEIMNAMKNEGKESSQDKFWGEDFWGEKFSWEQKDENLGDPKMWEIAAEMFSKPPYSNGHDARYTKVKTHLRKLYVVVLNWFNHVFTRMSSVYHIEQQNTRTPRSNTGTEEKRLTRTTSLDSKRWL